MAANRWTRDDFTRTKAGGNETVGSAWEQTKSSEAWKRIQQGRSASESLYRQYRQEFENTHHSSTDDTSSARSAGTFPSRGRLTGDAGDADFGTSSVTASGGEAFPSRGRLGQAPSIEDVPRGIWDVDSAAIVPQQAAADTSERLYRQYAEERRAQERRTGRGGESFWETLLNVSGANTGQTPSNPFGAGARVTEGVKKHVGGTIAGGVMHTAAELANAAGMAADLLPGLNDIAYDERTAQQRTAAENSLAYWRGVLEENEDEKRWMPTDEGDRKASEKERERQRRIAREQIARNERILQGFEEEKELHTGAWHEAVSPIYETADKLQDAGNELIGSAKEGAGFLGGLAVDVGAAGAQMAGDALANLIAPGSGLAAMGVRSFGGAAQQARQAGGNYAQQALTGVASATVEVLTEKMFGVFENIYGTGFLDDTKLANGIKNAVDRLNLTPAGRTALALLGNFGEEGIEEIVSGVVSPAIDSLYNGKTAGENYSEADVGEILYEGLVGGVMGLLGGTGQIANNAAETAEYGAVYGQDAAALVDEALEIDPDDKAAQRAKEKLKKGKELSGGEIRRIVAQNDAAIEAAGLQGNEKNAASGETTAVNDDPAEHTAAEQRVIEEYKDAVNPELVQFYQDAKSQTEAKKGAKPFELRPVSERAIGDIKKITGVDTTGFRTLFDVRQANHIYLDHGENGRADHTMADANDVGRMQYVLDNYDSVEDGGRTRAYFEKNAKGGNSPAKSVRFSKKVNGTYFVVEAVPNTNARAVNVVSAYMLADGKTPVGKNKKGAAQQTADVYTPQPNGRTAPVVTTPTNSISQTGAESQGQNNAGNLTGEAAKNLVAIEQDHQRKGADSENASAPLKTATAEPVHVGKATTIYHSYHGAAPVQSSTTGATVAVPADALARAQANIESAQRSAASGERGFKRFLRDLYEKNFRHRAVAVSDVSFDGEPYLVEIGRGVPGKVISDKNTSAQKLAVLDVLDDVVYNAEYVGSGEYAAKPGKNPKKVTRYDYFETPVEIDGTPYTVSFDVEVFPYANNYRTYRINEIELSPASGTDPGPEPGAHEGETALLSDATIPQASEVVKSGNATGKSQGQMTKAATEDWHRIAEHARQQGANAETVDRMETAYRTAYLFGTTGRLEARDHADLRALGLSDEQINVAFAHGKGAGNTQKMKGAEHHGEKQREVRVHDGSQRNGGKNPGRSGKAVGDDAAGVGSGRAQRGGGADRGGTEGATGAGQSSARELIGAAGSESGNQVCTVSSAHNKSTSRADARARKRGLASVFFTGGNLTLENGGEARAYIDLEAGKVYVRADDPQYSADQIMRHELGHDAIRKGKIDPAEVYERLSERYGEAELGRIMELYGALYADANMSTDEIWEEIVCDSLGEMNAFSDLAEVAELVDEFLRDTRTEAARGAQNKTATVKNTNRDGTDSEPMGKTSIVVDGSYAYVKADRQVLTGEDPDRWQKQVYNYINDVIRNSQDILIPTADGHALILTGRSAYKLSDRHVSHIAGQVAQLLGDDDYARKGRAATHIDELIQVGRFREWREDLGGKHENDIGEDGFNYYDAYFLDRDGKYYRVRFSAGINDQQETVYSIGGITERKLPTRGGSSSQKGGALKGEKLSADSIRTNEEKSQEVKTAVQVAFEKALAKKDGKTRRIITQKLEGRFSRVTAAEWIRNRYTYDELIKKPDMPITILAEEGEYTNTQADRKKVVDTAIKNAEGIGYLNEAGNAVVHVEDTDTDVILSKAGLRHGLDRRFSVNAPVVLRAGEILSHAIRINELTPNRAGVDESYVMIGAAKSKNNESYIVQFVVNRYSDEVTSVDVLYSENAKKEPAALLPEITGKPATLTGSDISIASLLDYVNRYFPDVLPEDVLRHYGHKERPAGKLGQSAKFSRVADGLEQVQQENEELRRQVNRFQKELRSAERRLQNARESRDNWRNKATFRPERVGQEIIKAYEGTVAESEIHSQVKQLVDYAARKDGITYEEMKHLAAPVAAQVVKSASAVANGEEAQTWNDLKRHLRGGRIKVSKEVTLDIGEWGDFWRRNGRRLNLVTGMDGISVDTAYEELRDKFGRAYFPDEITHPADQLRRIAEVYDNLQPVFENPYSLNIAMATEHCANDLVDMVMKEVSRGYMATYTGQLEEKLYQSRKYTKKLLEKERAHSDEQIRALKKHWQEEIKGRQDSELRQRLLNVAKRLKNKKLPTVSRNLLNQYAEQMLTEAQRDIFSKLDTESVGMRSSTRKELTWLRDLYERLEETDPNFIPDPATQKQIKRLSKLQIGSLTHQDVVELTKVLLNIENEIRNAKKLIDSAEKRDLREAGVAIMRDIRNSPGSKASGVGNFLDKFIVTETLSPLRQVRRMVGYVENDPLLIATKELADGQRRSFDYKMRAQARFQKFVDDKAFMNRIAGKHAELMTIQGIGEDGPTQVQITPAMKISLYLHSKNNQSLRHIAGGGILVPDTERYRKGDMKEAYARGTRVRLEPGQVKKIAARLTTEERRFADAVFDYFNTMSKEEVNAVSEKLLGYPVAEVENYFPINTDDSFTKKDFESIKYDGSVAGMGFLNERINSALPIYLRDVTDVLRRSIDQHSLYVGLGVAVRNFNKLWGVTARNYLDENGPGASSSVQSTVKQQWGETGRKYIEKMMSDLQTGGKGQDVWAETLNKVRSSYAGAVLTLNVSVAMKQAASYPTAAAVVGWKPLILAFKNVGKVDLDLIAAYTPLQWYRSQGFSTQELGDMAKRGIKWPAALNWVQGADLLTTRKLWKAAEIYVRENNPDLQRGTPAEIRAGESPFYKAVAEVYNRIIEETQPNYTTMQRPQLLRSENAVIQNLQMFKTQPFQNFNILYDAVGEWQAKARAYQVEQTEENKAAVREARKKVGRAVSSQIVQLFVFAGMTFLWNAFRGKKDKYKDKEGEESLLSTLGGIGLDMVGGLLSEIPFGSDVWEVGSNLVSGGRYYGVSDVTTSAINDVLNQVSNAYKTISGLLTGDITDANTVRLRLDGAVDAVSKLFGVPYENMANLGKAVYRIGAKALEGDYVGEYAYLQLTTDPAGSYKRDYYDLLYRAYKEDMAAHLEIRRRMIQSGYFDSEKIKGAMEDRMKKEQGVKSVNELQRRYTVS